MASVADWLASARDQNLWDRIFFDDEEVPCDTVVIGDAKVSKDIDVKTRKGEDGADYTDNGVPPAKFSITLMWLKPELAAQADALLERLDPRAKGSVTRPVAITHPKPNEGGISRVLIQAVSLPQVQRGVRTRVLDVIEYRPATPKTTTGVGKPKAVGYGDYEQDAADVAEYYAQQQQEIIEDMERGALSPEDGADAFTQSGLDQMTALTELYEANGQPAGQDNVDALSF